MFDKCYKYFFFAIFIVLFPQRTSLYLYNLIFSTFKDIEF